jgi:hypothetical protein
MKAYIYNSSFSPWTANLCLIAPEVLYILNKHINKRLWKTVQNFASITGIQGLLNCIHTNTHEEIF